ATWNGRALAAWRRWSISSSTRDSSSTRSCGSRCSGWSCSRWTPGLWPPAWTPTCGSPRPPTGWCSAAPPRRGLRTCWAARSRAAPRARSRVWPRAPRRPWDSAARSRNVSRSAPGVADDGLSHHLARACPRGGPGAPGLARPRRGAGGGPPARRRRAAGAARRRGRARDRGAARRLADRTAPARARRRAGPYRRHHRRPTGAVRHRRGVPAPGRGAGPRSPPRRAGGGAGTADRARPVRAARRLPPRRGGAGGARRRAAPGAAAQGASGRLRPARRRPCGPPAVRGASRPRGGATSGTRRGDHRAGGRPVRGGRPRPAVPVPGHRRHRRRGVPGRPGPARRHRVRRRTARTAMAGPGPAAAARADGRLPLRRRGGRRTAGVRMGLITGLLTLPLAPVRMTVWLGEQVRAYAQQQYAGRETVAGRLAEIEAARAAGDLTPERANELEQRVLDDLLGTEGPWTGPDDSEVWIGRQP